MNPGMERDGIFVGGENLANGSAEPGTELDENGQPIESREVGRVNEDAAAPYRPSYLLGINEVQELFQAGKFELAMVRVTELEKAYPNDAKLLSMMGTLWLQLGRRELARETWERVLQIDPENRAVIEALRQLNGE
jgi:tetratricopeptide (TPR) repeat protein